MRSFDHDLLVIGAGSAGCGRRALRRRTGCRLIRPLLSGSKLMIFWITKEVMNAGQAASPGRDYWQAGVVLAQGATTAEACRRIAISEQTYYRWRREYGGLKTDQARRMKDLEKENARLRRAISELTLDKLILQEAARGNV